MDAFKKIRRIWGLCAITAIVTAFLIAPLTTFAADNTFKFTVEQVFTTSSESADGLFTYRLKPLETGNPMPAGSAADSFTFTITGNRNAEIELIDFIRPGLFRYELSQVVNTEKPGYAYDKRVYTLGIYMDVEYNAELVVMNSDGTKTANIKFENSYDASPTNPMLMVDPPVRKIVSGNPVRGSVFTFALKAGNTSWPMPAGSAGGVKTITITGSGVSDFGTWSYSRTGIYTYTVYEVNTAERGYTYDTAVYTITDTVTDVNGQLVLSRAVRNNTNTQVETMAFINQYSIWGGVAPKTWDGMNINLYVTLLVLAGTAITGLIVYTKRQKKQNEISG